MLLKLPQGTTEDTEVAGDGGGEGGAAPGISLHRAERQLSGRIMAWCVAELPST